jgi:hypothetical protein
MQWSVSLRIFKIFSCLEIEVVVSEHSQNFKLVIKSRHMSSRI